ncbi:hypothetical protein XELAEV_18021475mg [Xenopus laevis]|uniref:Uncharacterized protein n=1 Tax=Xenopus laevis TaxID=8355 RepID=A0A974DBT9_XENLA|nr:hypothetical protein XELAEV_18021475mg [Xenopus laevis]
MLEEERVNDGRYCPMEGGGSNTGTPGTHPKTLNQGPIKKPYTGGPLSVPRSDWGARGFCLSPPPRVCAVFLPQPVNHGRKKSRGPLSNRASRTPLLPADIYCCSARTSLLRGPGWGGTVCGLWQSCYPRRLLEEERVNDGRYCPMEGGGSNARRRH